MDQDNEAQKTLVEAHRTSAAHFRFVPSTCQQYGITIFIKSVTQSTTTGIFTVFRRRTFRKKN
jgi:hypothetical protein